MRKWVPGSRALAVVGAYGHEECFTGRLLLEHVPVTGSYSPRQGGRAFTIVWSHQLCLKPFQIILALVLSSVGGFTTLQSNSRSFFVSLRLSQNLFPCGFCPLAPGLPFEPQRTHFRPLENWPLSVMPSWVLSCVCPASSYSGLFPL